MFLYIYSFRFYLMKKLMALKVMIIIYFLVFIVGHIDFSDFTFKTDINFVISFYLFFIPLNMEFIEETNKTATATKTILYSLLGPLFGLYALFT